jgi:hypothetical protein
MVKNLWRQIKVKHTSLISNFTKILLTINYIGNFHLEPYIKSAFYGFIWLKVWITPLFSMKFSNTELEISVNSFLISIPLIPYSYSVEVFHFSLDLYTIGRTPWTSDRPVARPLPKYRTTKTQNKHTHTPNIHALSAIRTHDHSVRASEDSLCLRQLGYRDRRQQFKSC